VVEVLPADGEFTRCDMVPGRTQIGTEDGRQVCQVEQVTVTDPNPDDPGTSGPGWYYDNFSTSVVDNCGDPGQRISFSSGAEPVTGTDVRLECLQPVQNTAGGEAVLDIGSPCPSPGAMCAAGTSMGDARCTDRYDMVCSDVDNTWQVPCSGDASCTNAGLAGWRCGGGICINPTCD